MIASMTGYARVDGAEGEVEWTWELRSVNGRGLDVRSRLPNPFDRHDSDVRQRLGAALSRGSVTVGLTTRQTARADALPTINEALLTLLIDAAARFLPHGAEPPRPEWLMGVRGVVEHPSGDARPATDLPVPSEALLASLDTAIAQLVTARREEGARLQGLLRERLDVVSTAVAGLRALSDRQTTAIRDRLQTQIADLLDGTTPPVPDERFAHEVALLATKADIREELDRLDAHVAQAKDLLGGQDAVGRRLDFLCQELNREANTICSKAADIQVTRLGLELKAVIDQIKEQVQNVE